MTWIIVGLMAFTALYSVLLLAGVRRGHGGLVAAALLIGLAGYAAQGSPQRPGAPKQVQETDQAAAARVLIEARQQMSDSSASGWETAADQLAGRGELAIAADILGRAVERDPDNADAWLSLGNVLLAHADGILTPPAQYAYQQAGLADPAAPGPPFFLGFAYAGNGQTKEAHALWSNLLAHAPRHARWRPIVSEALRRLEAVTRTEPDDGIR